MDCTKRIVVLIKNHSSIPYTSYARKGKLTEDVSLCELSYTGLNKVGITLQIIFFLSKLAPSQNEIFENAWTITYLTSYCDKSFTSEAIYSSNTSQFAQES